METKDRAKELKAEAVKMVDEIIKHSPTWKFTDYNLSGYGYKKHINRMRKISRLEEIVENLQRTIKNGGDHMCVAGNGIHRFFMAYK